MWEKSVSGLPVLSSIYNILRLDYNILYPPNYYLYPRLTFSSDFCI